MPLDNLERILANLTPNPETSGERGRMHCLADRMRLFCVSGVSLAIAHGGDVRVEAAGTLALDDPTPVNVQTPFYACSISKAVSAAGVLRLVAGGKLELDAEANDYLAEWKLTWPNGQPARATIRQLLSHTAGTNVHGAAGYDPDGPVPTFDDVLRGRAPALTAPVNVVTEPGSQYRYSSGGCLVLQQIVINITGENFPDAMRHLVLDPVGMADSQFSAGPPPMSHAFAHVSTIRRAAPETFLRWPELAAGGLWTTAGDLLRFAIAIQASLLADSFLPQDLATDMVRRQTGHHDIGLGVYLLGEGSGRRFSHTGGHLGWRAEVSGWLAGGHAFAIVINNGYTGSELKSEIVKAITSTLDWPT